MPLVKTRNGRNKPGQYTSVCISGKKGGQQRLSGCCVDWFLLTRSLSCVGGGGGGEEVSSWGLVVSRCRRGVLLVSGWQRPLAGRAGWLYNHRNWLTDWLTDWLTWSRVLAGLASRTCWEDSQLCTEQRKDGEAVITVLSPRVAPAVPWPALLLLPSPQSTRLPCPPQPDQLAGLTVALHQSQPSARQLGEMSKFK